MAHNGFSNNYFVSVLGCWTTETPIKTTSQIASGPSTLISASRQTAPPQTPSASGTYKLTYRILSDEKKKEPPNLGL